MDLDNIQVRLGKEPGKEVYTLYGYLGKNKPDVEPNATVTYFHAGTDEDMKLLDYLTDNGSEIMDAIISKAEFNQRLIEAENKLSTD